MYRSGQKLSDIELDAIDLYNHFPNKSIEIVAKELLIPIWFAQRAVFKAINGQVKNGYYQFSKKKPSVYRQVRHSVTPTAASVAIANQQTSQSGIKLRTKNAN